MANRLYKPVYQIWPTRNLIGEFGSGKAAHLAPQGPLGPVLTQWQNLWHKVAEHSGKGHLPRMLSNRDVVSLRNCSRGGLLCTVSYCSCQFERQTEGTFRAFSLSIYPKNGLKVRAMALLWRSQFVFAFRRERFAAVNGRFSVMGYRPQMVQTIVFSLTRKERNGR